MPVPRQKYKIDRVQITLNRFHVRTSDKAIPHANFGFWFSDDINDWMGKGKKNVKE